MRRLLTCCLGLVLLAGPAESLGAAQSIQLGLFGDPRVQQWSQLNLDGKADQALAYLERDLLSPFPHPLASYAWVAIHNNRADLEAALNTASPELRRRLGLAPQISSLSDSQDAPAMERLLPVADSETADPWSLLRISIVARDSADPINSLLYALATARKRPDCFLAGWHLINALEGQDFEYFNHGSYVSFTRDNTKKQILDLIHTPPWETRRSHA